MKSTGRTELAEGAQAHLESCGAPADKVCTPSLARVTDEFQNCCILADPFSIWLRAPSATLGSALLLCDFLLRAEGEFAGDQTIQYATTSPTVCESSLPLQMLGGVCRGT